MPIQSFGHSAFWNRDTSAPPPAVGTIVAYPAWQATVTCSSGFGAFDEGCRHVARLVVWWIAVARLLWRGRHAHASITPQLIEALVGLPAERVMVIRRVLGAFAHPAYPVARRAVAETATTLGFNHPEAWIPYSRELKASTRDAENVFRHLRVTHQLPRSLTNPERNLLAELAYHVFAEGTHFGVTK